MSPAPSYTPNYGGNWQAGSAGATPILPSTLNNFEAFNMAVAAYLQAAGGADQRYSQISAHVGPQTVPYTATANQIVSFDLSGGSCTLTLPPTPAQGTVVAYKIVALTSGNTLTVQAQGSDVFNAVGGSSALTGITGLHVGGLLEYDHVSGVWSVLADDLPLAYLETQFAPSLSLYVAPTGTAADDTNITAALSTLAGLGGGTVQLGRGTYWCESQWDVNNTLAIRGIGGGSASEVGLTHILCQTASSQIQVSGGGPETGDFYLDGNSTATTPWSRQGGTGANNRTFRKITVINNLPASNTNDLALIYGAQNDSWYDVAFAGADRDAVVFDQGAGGMNFWNCKVSTVGRYAHRYDNQVSGGVYAVPTQIAHYGGIIEGAIGGSCVYENVGSAISYAGYQFYSTTAPSGAHIQVNTGAELRLDHPTIQVGTSATVSGTTALGIAGTGAVTVVGRANVVNLATLVNLASTSSFVYDKAYWVLSNVTTTVSGAGSALQLADFKLGVLSWANATGVAIELNYNANRSGYWSGRTVDGTLQYWPGTGFGTYDTAVGRVGVGLWGVKAATYLLCTGTGSTASRPTGTNGATYANTDTDSLDVYVGGAWRSGGKAEWSKTLDLSQPPVSLSAGTWAALLGSGGYTSAGSGSSTYTATWVTNLGAGTWNLTVALAQAQNGCKVTIDYSFDNATWTNIVTAVDTYAASALSQIQETATGVVVAAPTPLYIRVTGTGTRNASNTTGYYAVTRSFQAQRTA